MLVVALSIPAVPAADRLPSLLADLPDETRSALERMPGAPLNDRDVSDRLQAVFDASTPYEFDTGPVTVLTDPRWFSTLPDAGPGAPLLELRRWPGDTVLALWSVPAAAGEGTLPPVPGGVFVREPAGENGDSVWNGTVMTIAGERRAVWVVRTVADSTQNLGALLLPGDAGLGDGAGESLLHELRAVLDRVQVRPPSWRARSGLPPGKPIQLPVLGDTPDQKSEDEAPWQVIEGAGFSVGLPPGLRARRTDGSVPPPIVLPGGLLWIRGRYSDIDGTRVIVGDERRVGHVARIAWPKPSEGPSAPLGVAGAKRLASEPYDLAVDRADAEKAAVERWSEPGFAGEWLVFRLKFAEAAYEIALPMLTGRQSPSLFWIPVTWRAAGQPPAPPPVDPAERFGIRFERITRTEQSRRPWTEGILVVPGLRVEIPKGWSPAASLRSINGFPVRLLDAGGREVGRLERRQAGELPESEAGSAAWQQSDERGGLRAAARLLRRDDGSYLVETRGGEAFLFAVSEVREDERELWSRMVLSAQLSRAKRKP